MKKITLLLLFLLGNTALFAQQNAATDGSWTLQEAIKYAWDNNIQVRQSQLQVESSEINYLQSKMSRLPTLNGEASHGYAFGRTIDPRTNQFTEDPFQFNRFGLFSSVNIFGGFQIHNQIKARYAQVEAARDDARSAKNIVGLQVTNAYLQVLLNKELAAIASLQTETSREQLERTRILVEAGSLPQANLYDIESQLATDEVAAVNAENNLEIARLNLLQALQLPAGQTIEIEPVAVDMSGLELTSTSPQEIFAIAIENQPEIKAARHRQLSSKYNLQATRGALYPILSLNGNYGSQYSSKGVERVFFDEQVEEQIGVVNRDPNMPVYTYFQASAIRNLPFMEQLDLNKSGNISLNLTVPIFNNYRSRSQVVLARIQHRTADLELANEMNQLRVSIEQSYADARAAAKRYAALQKQVESLELAFRNAETRRDVGAISSYDYIFAKNNLDRARAELSQAKYTYVFRLKVLDFYLGNPLSIE